MRKTHHLILFTFLTFVGGMFTHAKLYARPLTEAEAITRNTSAQNTKAGMASWYSRRSPGIRKHTANNEIFDDNGMTCAMWGVPFNQRIRVTNTDNGKSVVVRVNDRGPHKRYFHRGRIVDLSKRAFSEISGLHEGLINVEVEFL